MKDVVKTSSTNYKNVNSRQRSPQSNTRRKRKKKNYSIYYFFVFILMAVAFVVLSLTVFFNINKITITGSSVYSEQEIFDAAEVKVGDNLFRKKISVMEQNVMNKLTDIDNVKITRCLPSQLHMEITPSVPTANIEYEAQYFIISKNGKVLKDKLDFPEENLLLIKGYDPVNCKINTILESNDKYKDEIIKSIFEAIENNSFEGITQIDITDRLNILLLYNDRIEIELGSSLDLNYKITFVKTIIDGNIAKDFEGKIIMRGDSGVSVIKKEDLEN